MMRILVLLATILTMMPAVSSAQNSFSGCVDSRGLLVTPIRNVAMREIARVAVTRTGQPTIQYNPTVLLRLSWQSRLFFYGHECAHFALGHGTVNILQAQEQEADCWSVRVLIARGLINGFRDVQQIQADLAFSPSEWSHVPGPVRLFNLSGCLGFTVPR